LTEIKGMQSLTGPQENELAWIRSRVQGASAEPVRVTPGPISPAPHATAPDAMGLLRAFRRRWGWQSVPACSSVGSRPSLPGSHSQLAYER
jgi:hypothetical protein